MNALDQALAEKAAAKAEAVESRDRWLNARRVGVGGSDASVMLGCSPYHSLLSLYLDKTGQTEPTPDEIRLRWGRRLERAVLDEYEYQTGNAVVDQSCAVPDRVAEVAPGVKMLQNRSVPVAIGNTDGIVIVDDPRGPGVIDAKTVDGFAFRKWISAGRPQLNYLVQLVHYMEIAGLKWGVIAAFSGLNDSLYIYEIEYDAGFAARLMEAEDIFWRRYVMRRQPPPADASEASAKALRIMYPKDTGRVVQLTGPAVEWAHTFDDLTERVKLLTSKRDEVKTKLMATIGDATAGILPDGTGFTFKAGKRSRSLLRATEKSMRKYQP